MSFGVDDTGTAVTSGDVVICDEVDTQLIGPVRSEILLSIQFFQPVGYFELPTFGPFFFDHTGKGGVVIIENSIPRFVATYFTIGQANRRIGIGSPGFIGLHFHQSPHEKTVSFGNFFLHFTTVGGQFDPNLIERFTGNIYRVFGQLFTIGFVEKCVESSFVHEDGFLLQSGSELIVIAFVFFVDQIDNFGVKIGIDIVVVYFKQCSE